MLEIKIQLKWCLINKNKMLNLDILKKSWYFTEVFLEKWEVLLKEGEVDDNIYIILAWELSVEKFTTKQKNETKILAYLKTNDVFWEAALNEDKAKEVSVIAKRKSVLLSINAKDWLMKFWEKYPAQVFELLKYLVFLWNKRLSEANYLITASYKISNEIMSLEEINNKKIFELIEKLKDSVKVEHIMYYETNPVVSDYITLKYDTREKWKLQNKVEEITNNKLNLLDLNIKDYFSYTQELSIWKNNLWYLVFLKKWEKFSESDKKVLATTSTSIAGLIKQKQLLDEERDKNFMED